MERKENAMLEKLHSSTQAAVTTWFKCYLRLSQVGNPFLYVEASFLYAMNSSKKRVTLISASVYGAGVESR